MQKNKVKLQEYKNLSKEEDDKINTIKPTMKVEEYKYIITNAELKDSGNKVCSKCGSKLNPAAIIVVKRDIEDRIKASVKKIRNFENDIRLYHLHSDKRTEDFIALNTSNEQVRQEITEKRSKHTDKSEYKEIIEDLKKRLKQIDQSKEDKLSKKIEKQLKYRFFTFFI